MVTMFVKAQRTDSEPEADAISCGQRPQHYHSHKELTLLTLPEQTAEDMVTRSKDYDDL